MIRVLIADEYPLIRAGLRYEISLHPDFSPPGEAIGDDHALALLAEQQWDVVILEMKSLPLVADWGSCRKFAEHIRISPCWS